VGRRGRDERPGRREGGAGRGRDRPAGGAEGDRQGEDLGYKDKVHERLDRMDKRLESLEQRLERHLKSGDA
jgi:hypothetical protein